jgi:polar amino acid transport system substrate-binding protein
VRLLTGLALVSLLGSCGDFPKDSHETLKRARAGEPIKVGYAVAEPWVREGPSGIEPDLLNAWARSNGVRLQWMKGSEGQLVEALTRNSADLLLGGLESKTPHGKMVGLTQPYLSVKIVIGAAPGAPIPNQWKGIDVAYDARRPHFAAAIEKAKAIAVPAMPTQRVRYAAVYEPELGARGLRDTGKTLLTEKRVMAGAPAENALVLSLDKFLHERKAAIAGRVAAEARR